MKRIVVFVAVCSTLLGCGPSSLYECKIEAAKMPTERGASIAAIACAEKFHKPGFFDDTQKQ